METQCEVLKFGGSCLSSAEDFSNAAGIISTCRNPVVVVSAINGVTQELIDICGSADNVNTMEKIHGIQRIHLDAISKITGKRTREPSIEDLRKQFQELIRIATGSATVDSPEKRALILSFGERLSAAIMKWYLMSLNLKAAEVSADEIIVAADENILEATADVIWSKELIRQKIYNLRKGGSIPVITGFFCRTPSGKTAILGRNSSDYTAALVSGSLAGSTLTFWKDVPGLMTGDPKFVKECRVLRHIGYEEAEAYISNGARILHKKVIALSKENGVPIRIRDFRNPGMPGTTIGNLVEFGQGSGQAHS